LGLVIFFFFGFSFFVVSWFFGFWLYLAIAEKTNNELENKKPKKQETNQKKNKIARLNGRE